jgi:DNA replication protein DnaC
MRFWNGPQLLVIDELGYVLMPGEAAAHLFHVNSRRYEHGSIILTTNRGIAAWGEISDHSTVAAAILDRLLRDATVLQIDGDSYRMRGQPVGSLRRPTRLWAWSGRRRCRTGCCRSRWWPSP